MSDLLVTRDKECACSADRFEPDSVRGIRSESFGKVFEVLAKPLRPSTMFFPSVLSKKNLCGKEELLKLDRPLGFRNGDLHPV